jgi:hypothetical protein
MNIEWCHFNKNAHVTEHWILIPIEFFLTTINPIGFPYGFKSKNNLLLNEILQNSIKCTCEIGISMKSVVAYFNFSKLVLHSSCTGLPILGVKNQHELHVVLTWIMFL